MNSLHSILLVEHDDGDAVRIEGLLPAVRVDRVRGLTEALERSSPALTVLDLELPESSGLDTLVRYRDAAPDVPVVVLIGGDDDHLGQEAIRHGAQDYLNKGELAGDLLWRTLSRARERHALLRMLEASEQRMRALVDAMPDLVIEVDEEGGVSMVNRHRDVLSGTSWRSLVPHEEQERYEEMRRQVVSSGEPVTFESRTNDAKRGVQWFHVTMARLGRSQRCVVLCRDITDAMLEKERFEQALEAAPAGMLLVDAAGRMVMVNGAVEQLFGYERDELVGEHVELLVPPRLHARHRAERGHYALEPDVRGMTGGREVFGVTKDGDEVPVEIGLTPVRTSRGTEVLCSISDVRSRKHLEEQLRHAQKLEAIGRLAGGVAHDFNNVLSAIFSFGNFVLEELPKGGRAREDMDEVLAAAQRAASLTSQLLAFSRRQAISPSVLSLVDLVANLEKMLARVIGEDVELVTELDAATDPVIIDGGAFEHVVLNLAVNARDAMPRGGRLVIGCTNAALDRSTLLREGVSGNPGRYVRLRVSDNGVGMDPETRSRIFEPFYTTKERGKGTGLGLSTVYGVVAQAGGFVLVDSSPGRGTTFDLYLPAAVETDSVETRPTTDPMRGGDERILVVEDDDQVRAATRRCLAHLGYRVVTASNGSEALSIAGQGELDLVLTDLVMPDIDGVELAERLSAVSAAPVLFMTGYAPESIRARGLTAHMETLHKPFKPGELAACVRELLDRSRSS